MIDVTSEAASAARWVLRAISAVAEPCSSTAEAIDCDEFKLCRKKSNLFKRNGIVWKEKKGVIKQVGIKQTALVQFIRNQNGYQNYSSRKITDYLKDIGCLTINEDKSNTVHLGKIKDGKRSLPRVLLIDVQTLRDNAEKYELFAEQARE